MLLPGSFALEAGENNWQTRNAVSLGNRSVSKCFRASWSIPGVWRHCLILPTEQVVESLWLLESFSNLP